MRQPSRIGRHGVTGFKRGSQKQFIRYWGVSAKLARFKRMAMQPIPKREYDNIWASFDTASDFLPSGVFEKPSEHDADELMKMMREMKEKFDIKLIKTTRFIPNKSRFTANCIALGLLMQGARHNAPRLTINQPKSRKEQPGEGVDYIIDWDIAQALDIDKESKD